MCYKIGNVYKNKEAMEEFHQILNLSQSTKSIEEKWDEWLVKNNLKNNKWLDDIFEIIHQWCPPYMTSIFFASMQKHTKK